MIRPSAATAAFSIANPLSWFWILASISMLGQPAASRRFIPQYLAAGNKACVKGFILFARRSSVACGLFLGVASTVVVLVFEGRGWIEDATTKEVVAGTKLKCFLC